MFIRQFTASAPVNLPDSYFQNHPNVGITSPFRGQLGDIVSLLLLNAMAIASLYFIYLIIHGGYLLIIFGGQINPPQRVQQGKNSVTYGVLGLLLVISAYFILQIISTITGVNLIDPPFV